MVDLRSTAPKSVEQMRSKATAKMYGQVDEAELMCRMLEAANNMKRPAGLTASEALNALDMDSRPWLRRMARAALGYMVECLNTSEKPS